VSTRSGKWSRWLKDTPIFGGDRVVRDEERKQFAALMRKVEAVRIRYRITKTELAAELGANADGVRALKATKSR
jgi:hypothetical protein